MRVLSVSQINFFIKSLIEGDGRMRDIYARGEISNFTDHYRSGHLYFSLKDEKSVLKAVMFSSAARRRFIFVAIQFFVLHNLPQRVAVRKAKAAQRHVCAGKKRAALKKQFGSHFGFSHPS